MREMEKKELVAEFIKMAILKYLRAGEIITSMTIIELLRNRIYNESEENISLLNSDYNKVLRILEELAESGHLKVVTIRATKQRCYLKI